MDNKIIRHFGKNTLNEFVEEVKERIISKIEKIEKAIPTKVSQLENDTVFATEEYVNNNSGKVKTVNGNEPDENGNIEVDIKTEQLIEKLNEIPLNPEGVHKWEKFNTKPDGSGEDIYVCCPSKKYFVELSNLCNRTYEIESGWDAGSVYTGAYAINQVILYLEMGVAYATQNNLGVLNNCKPLHNILLEMYQEELISSQSVFIDMYVKRGGNSTKFYNTISWQYSDDVCYLGVINQNGEHSFININTNTGEISFRTSKVFAKASYYENTTVPETATEKAYITKKGEVVVDAYSKALVDEKIKNASGASSWNDLTDKPFGEEGTTSWLYEAVELNLNAELAKEFDAYDVNANLAPLFTEDALGTVVYLYWDGTFYKGVVEYHHMAMEYFVRFDNGFELWKRAPEGFYQISFDESKTGVYTFGLASSATTITVIDEKFLPKYNGVKYTEQLLTEKQQNQARKNLGVLYSEEKETVETLFKHLYVGWWETDEDKLSSTNIHAVDYDVNFLGARYIVTGKSIVSTTLMVGITSGLFWIGNPTLIKEEDVYSELKDRWVAENEYTDLPFVVYWHKVDVVAGDGTMVGSPTVVIDSSTSASMGQSLTISRITGMETVYETLDENYIPNNIPKIQTAEVGQALVVKEVDENNKPTEWECIDAGGAGSWNDLADKPFGEDVNEEMIIDSYQHTFIKQLSGSEVSGYNWGVTESLIIEDSSHADIWTEGEQITILWNGVEYNAEVTMGKSQYMLFPDFGCTIYLPSSETPSFIFYPIFDEYYETLPEGMNIGDTEEFPVTFSLYRKSTIIKQLDEKYLPDHTHSWDDLTNKPFDRYIDEQYENVFKSIYFGVEWIINLDSLSNIVKENNVYNVTLLGESYNVVSEFNGTYLPAIAGYVESLMWIGNPSLIDEDTELHLGSTNNLDLPFVIYWYGGEKDFSGITPKIITNIEIGNGEELVVKRSMGEQLVYVQMEDGYLPDNIPKIQSATVGQTIVVKEVDEYGKPTEWECVNAGGGLPVYNVLDFGYSEEGDEEWEHYIKPSELPEGVYCLTIDRKNVENNWHVSLFLFDDDLANTAGGSHLDQFLEMPCNMIFVKKYIDGQMMNIGVSDLKKTIQLTCDTVNNKYSIGVYRMSSN